MNWKTGQLQRAVSDDNNFATKRKNLGYNKWAEADAFVFWNVAKVAHSHFPFLLTTFSLNPTTFCSKYRLCCSSNPALARIRRQAYTLAQLHVENSGDGNRFGASKKFRLDMEYGAVIYGEITEPIRRNLAFRLRHYSRTARAGHAELERKLNSIVTE